MRTLAIYNLKGGVGKTAAAVNLAALAAAQSLPTLLWDLDPQGAASWYLHADADAPASKRVWAGQTPIGKAIQHSRYPGLDLIPADFAARHLDAWMRKEGLTRTTLQKLLKPLSESYSLIVLDCPPSLSHLADAVFTAADLVLVPVVPTHLSLRALKALIDYFKEEGYPRGNLKPFFSMADRRRLLHRMLIEQPPKTMRDVCTAVIPYATAVERMGEHRAPLEVSEPASTAAQAYRELWAELEPLLTAP